MNLATQIVTAARQARGLKVEQLANMRQQSRAAMERRQKVLDAVTEVKKSTEQIAMECGEILSFVQETLRDYAADEGIEKFRPHNSRSYQWWRE
jgi:uncharacterized coiled-coil DUF342 family protein